MEHRWGERVELHLTVELYWGSSPPVVGSVVNVSASGAFVRTRGKGPPRGPVEVMFAERAGRETHSVRLPAYVVRETSAGVGIEWREFAPRAVRELLLRDRRAGGARTGARTPSSSRYLRAANTAMHPRGQTVSEPAAIGTSTLPVLASAATEWA